MSPRSLINGLIALNLAMASGCGKSPTVAAPRQAPVEAPSRSIPEANLGAVMQAHLKGVGLMEQYEYTKATEAFREVRRLAPRWTPGSINLAIALLNDTGNKAEKAKKEGKPAPTTTNYDEALALLDDILERDPKDLHAHYCRGIIYQQKGGEYTARAHEDFKFVTESDPTDGHAWYWRAATLLDAEGNPAGPAQAEDLIKFFETALARNPYLDAALYRLQQAYSWARKPDKQKEWLDFWNTIKPDRGDNVPGPGETLALVYGSMGKYATVINAPDAKPPAGTVPPPKFDVPTPIKVALPDGHRWAKTDDFEGGKLAVFGRVRDRLGAAVASFDADGDGKLDLYLAAAIVGPKGLRDALLRNLGDGSFEDASAAFKLPEDRPSLGVAAGDFNADTYVDVFLTGVGDNRLLRNAEGKAFEDVTKEANLTGPAALSLSARWLDLDQDGDLDLYVINYTSADHADAAFTDEPPPGLANAAYRNDGRPSPDHGKTPSNWAPPATAIDADKATSKLSAAFSPWPEADGLLGGEARHTSVAALDIDADRDIDLVLGADGVGPVLALNDRLGRFRAKPLPESSVGLHLGGLLVTDVNKSDDRSELVGLSLNGDVVPFRLRDMSNSEIETTPCDARDWRSAVASDLDLDGWPDLLGLPSGTEAVTPVWSRNDGKQFRSRSLGLGADATPLVGLTLADVVGDPLPDLVLLKDGQPPQLARNLGNGNHWLALELGGRWNVKPKLMRTNPHGLGTKISVEGRGFHVPYDHTTPVAGLAQSVGPIVLGLGKNTKATLVHLKWPDGVMQCEIDLPADQLRRLAENNRKEGSCPVLFTFDGERFVCIGDFLGGGGLGYLVAPGEYGQPDRDEAVAIAPNQLKAVDGVFRLSITEPMSEVAYLDHLTLDVVDRPPGIEATTDERFAPGSNRPTGKLVAWKTTIEPVRATDLKGKDMSDVLRAWDRRIVDDFRRLSAWIGYAEEHGIVLDFGDRLSKFGPKDSLVLCLAGWVEYPYSQTNYAAATAGVPLKPPVLERRRGDGSWEVIEADPGYPAGMPRLMTLDLTGKLTGARCVVRLRTNMECYYDQAFLAVRELEAGLKVSSLPMARAQLGPRGYTREVSPDGRLPLIYDYDYIDPAPLARLSGMLTRYGGVASLLRADDDRLCLVGPGDEVRLEFEAKSLPELPTGWTRSFVLRSVGYCKDADPFTATSDTIGPLPWKGMGRYPFGPEGERPSDPDYRAYLREFQTRPSGQ